MSTVSQVSQGLAGKKIIGFDGWSGGLRHYSRFVNHESFEFNSFKLIHLGSWGAQLNVPKHEVIDGIDVYDISYYDSEDFFDILNIEQPDCVVFLSTHVFDHRAMIKVCKRLNIRTLHIFPGVLGVLALQSKSIYKFSIYSHIRNLFSRLPKLIFHTFFNYVKVLIKTRANKRDWLDFAKDLTYGALRLNQKRYSIDSTAESCLVYINSERKIAIDKYGYLEGQVSLIGLPDITDFNLCKSDVLYFSKMEEENRLHNKDVLYFDTGYIYTGDLFSSVDEYVDHITLLAKYMKNLGLNLIFKPKPQKLNPLKDELLSKLKIEGIDIYEGNDVIARAKKCCCVFSEPSTVALVTALLGLPVFLVSFGRFNGQQYGECITSYPNSVILKSIDDFELELSKALKNTNLENWIESTFDGEPIKDVAYLTNKSLMNLLS